VNYRRELDLLARYHKPSEAHVNIFQLEGGMASEEVEACFTEMKKTPDTSKRYDECSIAARYSLSPKFQNVQFKQ
jgi:hypothetical protein